MLLKRVPLAATALGFAGLIPFYATALGLWLTTDPVWAGFLLYVQLLYAAVIASFMGAVHWGLAMANLGWEGQRRPDPARLNDGGDAVPRLEGPVRQLMLSVVPALIGWAVVLTFQLVRTGWLELVLMFLLFTALYFGDRQAARFALAPEWYLDLRKPLTIAVQTALALSLVRFL